MPAKPQPKKAPRKRSIRLEKEMIAEAGGLCAWCRKPETLQVHHIDGNRANTVPQNLVALCGTCHVNAEKGFPSPADLTRRKRELQWQRTAMACHSPQKATKIKVKSADGAQIADTINNTFHGVKPPRPMPATDAIEADAAMKSYVQYLIEKYIWCRLEEQKRGDPRRFHPAMAKNIARKAVGGFSPYGAPQTSFDVVARRLVALVCRTKWAQQINYKPHSWEKHQAMLRGEADDGIEAELQSIEEQFDTPYDDILKNSPRDAVFASWRDTERAALRVLDSKVNRSDLSARVPAGAITAYLVRLGLIDSSHGETLVQLESLKDRFEAAPQLKIEQTHAAQYCVAATKLIAYLKTC